MSLPKDKKTTPFPLTIINDLAKANKLSFNPFYQREAVWTKYQKQLLIDSILHEIDIPKIYLRKISKEGFEYEVVDGQQRIRAITEFMDNEFDLSEETDKVDGIAVARLSYDELPTNIQTKLKLATFDVCQLNQAYTEDDVEEMFARLQNGTPLNAAEKRRALHSDMRYVVEALSKHKVFELVGFNDKRYAYEDAVAKVLHIFIHGSITEIRPTAIKATYLANKSITKSDRNVKDVDEAFDFLAKAFDGITNPEFQKFAIITLSFLVHEMLGTYDVKEHAGEFGDAYLDFESKRIADLESPDDKRNPVYIAYYDAARSDSIPSMEFRHRTIRDHIVTNVPDLECLDPSRAFSPPQRWAVYRRDGGKCQNCGKKVDENDYHVDHIKPYSKGGKTTLANAQLLCPSCNAKKKDKM